MEWTLGGLLLAVCVLGPVAAQSRDCIQDERTVYDYSFTAIDEHTPIPMGDYEGKAVIVVNVATYWGKKNLIYEIY